MKKKIISILLAALMLVPMLAACGDDSSLPPPDTDGESAGGETDGGSDTTSNKPDTTETVLGENGLPMIYFSGYVPDPNAQYTGMFGIAANVAGVDIDDFRIVASDKKDVINEDFSELTELNSLVFTEHGEGNALSDWTVVADETDEENKHLSFSKEGGENAMILVGNSAWGAGRINFKVKLAAETETASALFCVKDEKNYYELAVSTVKTVLYEVVNGEKKELNSLSMAIPADTWVPLSVNITNKQIVVYVNSNEILHISTEPSTETLVAGKFGIGQWQTQYVIDNLKITDIKTGEVYYENDFENAADFVASCTTGVRNGGSYTPADGDWAVRKELDADGNEVDNMVLACDVATSVSGAMLIFPDIAIPADCEGYTITFDVMRTKGASATSEGWAIVWGYSADTDYINYNWGGWSGCGGFQIISGGSKTNKNMATTIGLEDYVWKTSEVQVLPDVAYSYYNGTLIQINWN